MAGAKKILEPASALRASRPSISPRAAASAS
jgi:hypothetical protein